MADRIAVMSDGVVLQVGTAEEIYERPTSRFVADFIGETNFMTGKLEWRDGEDGAARLPSGELLLGTLRDTDLAVGEDVTVAVRPEKLELNTLEEGSFHESAAGPTTELRGVVAGVHYLGTDARYQVRSGDFVLTVRVQNQRHGFSDMLQEGTEVLLRWRPEYCSLLP